MKQQLIQIFGDKMGSAPKHKKVVYMKPDWLKHQESFNKRNKRCAKEFPECPEEEGKFCENCPFK
jgi:hypothetical protein